MTELELFFRATSMQWQVDLGKTERALAELGPIADLIEGTGDKLYTSVRGWQMQLLAECGRPELAPDPDELLDAAREIGEPERTAYALLAAAQLFHALNELPRARALVRELDELWAAQPRLLYLWTYPLPMMSRLALALGEQAFVERLANLLEPVAPLDHLALVTIQAQLAEAGADHESAARLYRQAAEGWEQFGRSPSAPTPSSARAAACTPSALAKQPSSR